MPVPYDIHCVLPFAAEPVAWGLRPFDATAVSASTPGGEGVDRRRFHPGGRIADRGWWGRVHRRQSRNGRPHAKCWCSAGRQVLIVAAVAGKPANRLRTRQTCMALLSCRCVPGPAEPDLGTVELSLYLGRPGSGLGPYLALALVSCQFGLAQSAATSSDIELSLLGVASASARASWTTADSGSRQPHTSGLTRQCTTPCSKGLGGSGT